MKTRAYCYWLKGYNENMCFRLEEHSEAYILWNNYFLGKKKKQHTKSAIEEIIKLARERIGDKGHFARFLIEMKNEYGSSQKAFNRIFELALERYLDLQSKGQVPILIPHRVITPRTESRKQSIEMETRERTQKKIRRTESLEIVKAWFSDDLRKLLIFQYEDRNVILRTKKYPIPKEKWIDINQIVQDHKGKWIRDYKKSHWEIPLV